MAQPLLVTSFGAKPDGSDIIKALIAAVAVAKAQAQPLMLTAGVWNYSDIVDLGNVEFYGECDSDGTPLATLFATNPARCALMMSGAGANVRGIRLGGVVSDRLKLRECCRVMARNAIGFTVSNMIVEVCAGASIRMDTCRDGHVHHNTIRDSKADSIHMTAETSDVLVEENLIERSGDDSVAVVSYLNAPDVCRRITVRHNTALNSKAGRFMSVVGGDEVLLEDNYIADAQATGFYFACEHNSDWQTKATTNVIARNNALVNVGGAAHGTAVMVFSDTAERKVDNIVIDHNVIRPNPGRSGVRFSRPNGTRLAGLENMMETRILSVADGGDGKQPPFYAINDPANTTTKPYVSGPVGKRV